MKKLLTIIGLVFSLSMQAQFSLKVETAYLQQINQQPDKMLHNQNHHNAEMMVDSLLLKPEQKGAALFLTELAKSYLIAGKMEMAAYSVVRQRAIFPNDSVSAEAKAILQEAMISLNYSEESVKKVIEATSPDKFHNHRQGWAYAIRVTYSIDSKELDGVLQKTILLYQSVFPREKNMVLEEIRLVCQYGIPLKYRQEIINREAENEEDWIKTMPKKARMVYLRKKMKWYNAHGGKRQAELTLKQYKEQQMNFGQALFYGWKSFWWFLF